jgi:hypothetical protein
MFPGTGERELRWRLQPEDAGPVLEPVSRTEAWLTLPPAAAPFSVVVEDTRDPAVRARLEFRAGPGNGPGPRPAALVPDAFSPALSRFPGRRHRFPAAPAARIAHGGAAFAEAREPALRRLADCWIVAGAWGIRALSATGKEVPVPGIPESDPEPGCQALAVLPPGEGPWAPDAPRLVYSRRARIFALGPDGAHREWAPGWHGEAQGRRTVRDLALDRDGNVFVACREDRDILRIDLAGNVLLHARLPAAGGAGGGAGDAGILAMVLDPASGDLWAGDAAGLWRITADGSAALEREAGSGWSFHPCHLALGGRHLVLADPVRRRVLDFNLEHRRWTTLLGPAEGAGTRFGPLQGPDPGLPADACAALGAAGALAIGPGGWCLMAVERGLASFALPGAPVPAVAGPAEAGPASGPPAPAPVAAGPPSWAPGPGLPETGPQAPGAKPQVPRRNPQGAPPHPAGTARQRALAHFRWFQLGIRNHKKQLRAQGRRRALEEAEARVVQARLQRLAEARPARPSRGPAGARRVRGWAVPAMAICLVGGPSSLHALSQNLPPLAWSFPPPGARTLGGTWTPSGSPSALPGLAATFAFPPGSLPGVEALAQACALPGRPTQGVPDCDPDALGEARAQAEAVQALQARLLVDPEVLGAGRCVPLPAATADPEAFALVTMDQLAQFDQLNLGASSLSYRIGKGGFVLQAAGSGLVIGSAVVLPNGTLPIPLPGFILGELGYNLFAAGAYTVAGSGAYLELAAEAQVHRARYQAWVHSQDPAAWNCSAAAAAPAAAGSGPVLPDRVASPLPAMADLLARRADGCALLRPPGIAVPGCDEAFLTRWQRQNATLGALFQGQVACLTAESGTGLQSSCPDRPLASDRDRSRAGAALERFAAEAEVPAAAAASLGYGFFGAFGTLAALATAALEAGDLAGSDAWRAASDTALLVGTAGFADEFALLESASAARGLQVRLERESLAESLARLNRTAAPAPVPAPPGPG